LKCDGTRWRTGGEVKGKLANGVGRQYPSIPRNLVYPALLPLMRTPQLAVVDWTDAPTDLNGLVRFAERQSGFCACAIIFKTQYTIIRQVNYSSHPSSPFLEDNFTAHINLTRTVGDKNYELLRRGSIPIRHIREQETLFYTVPWRMASRRFSLERWMYDEKFQFARTRDLHVFVAVFTTGSWWWLF
jgi:hypothetical protein